MRTILLSAYGCEPNRGSEPGVGWHFLLQLAQHNEVFVITRANNESAIADQLPPDLESRVTFFYYDLPPGIRAMKHGERGLYPYYFLWQLGIRSLAKRIVAERQVDYIMHITLGSIWMPTWLSGLGVPFIWGPLGGGEGVPREHLRSLPLQQQLIQRFRGVLKRTASLNPFIRRTSRQASIILARTHETADLIPRRDRSKTRVLLETGIGDDVLGLGRLRETIALPLRLVTSGRLVPSKNTCAAIEALALLPDHYGAVLEILGDGPERPRCERLVARLGLEDRVFFSGNLPRPVALQHTLCADVFLMPSLKECGSWALMEAMALGVPSICLRWTGMRVIASDSTSIMLDPHEPTPLARRMSEGICRIVETPGLAGSMSKAATERIATLFTWDASGAFLQGLLEGADEGGSSVAVGSRS